MTRDELMRLAAEKALREVSWESIEFLFRPVNGLELLLRLDFDGARRKVDAWCADDSPQAMPHRFRAPHIAEMLAAVRREEFYREMVAARDRNPLAGARRRTDDNLRRAFGLDGREPAQKEDAE